MSASPQPTTISDSLQIRHSIAVLNQIKEGANGMKTFYELSDDALWNIYTTNIQEYMTQRSQRRLSQDYFETPTIPKMPKGMANVGNTCFFNSAIKSLYAIAPLTNFFLLNKIQIENDLKIRKAEIWRTPKLTDQQKDINHKRISSIESYINILQKFQENRELLADDLQNQVPKMCTIIFNKEFDYQQQDAGEVIIKLLEFIQYAWKEKNPNNPINQLFIFKQVMLNRGMNGFCKSYNSIREEFHTTLNLSINPKLTQKIKLQTLINNYFGMEKIDDYECDETNDPDKGKRGSIARFSRLGNCPEFLIIILKRDAYQQLDITDIRKVQNPIDYPHQLDVKPFLSKEKSVSFAYQNISEYHLISVAYHQGPTITGGHWFAKTKHQDQWYLHNDSITKQISKEEIHDNPTNQPRASILIYQRKDARKSLPYSSLHPSNSP